MNDLSVTIMKVSENRLEREQGKGRYCAGPKPSFRAQFCVGPSVQPKHGTGGKTLWLRILKKPNSKKCFWEEADLRRQTPLKFKTHWPK